MNSAAKPNRKAFALIQAIGFKHDGQPRRTGMHASTAERAAARCKTLAKTCGGVWTFEPA